MKKKSTHVISFLEGLHEFIVNDPQFRKKTSGKSEVEIQTELRPLIIRYLEKYFDDKGYDLPSAAIPTILPRIVGMAAEGQVTRAIITNVITR